MLGISRQAYYRWQRDPVSQRDWDDAPGEAHENKPYTPQHNGKVERYQRILAEELLNARDFSCEDARSTAITVWNIHYNTPRPSSGAGGRPPASRLPTGDINVQSSYS